MKHTEISPTDRKIFLLKTSFWVVFLGWTTFALALFGIFYKSLILLSLVLGVAMFGKLIFRKNLLAEISKEFWLVSLGLFVLVGFFAFFVSPSVFSGRDQGAISEAAIRLAQNHHLEFSTPASSAFFQIYGPGRALNFPGFHYQADGQLITQFPLAYIAWLAAFFSFFGLTGFILANAILLYVFLLALYLLARNFVSIKFALLTPLFVLTNFAFVWLMKMTLSENMALALVWFAIFALFNFWEERNNLNFYAFLFAGTLLVFTRIEGIAILLASMLVLFFNRNTRTYLFANGRKTLLLPGIWFLFFVALNFIKDFSFYKEIGKALFNSIQAAPSGTMEATIFPPFKQLYLGKIFFLYGFLGFFLLGSLGAAWLFVEKRFQKLIPLFLTLPTWSYLVDSHISSDHPWMLRRFLFTLLPVFIFYTVLIFSFWNKKWPHKKTLVLTSLLTILLVANSLPAFARYATYQENKTLLSQTKNFAQNFSARDLILMDKEIAGSGWAMITGPLNFFEGKNAVYFFNPQDLAKIDRNAFENIYLVIPEAKQAFYASILGQFTLTQKYVFQNNQLEIAQKKVTNPELPQKENFRVNDLIYKLNK